MFATILLIAVVAIVATFYAMAGYYIRPDPDMDDLGWCGGLLNNPFRFRDNINRNLLALAIVVYPGRLLAEAAIWIARSLQRR